MYATASLHMRRVRRTALWATLGLGATQIIAWGSTFTSLTVFGTPMGKDLGLQREVVFGGIAVMLLVSATLAPRVGKLIDRLGARYVMTSGSLLAAIAMLAQAQASDLFSYVLAWVLFGVAMPLVMNSAAIPALVQVVGPNARRAVTGLTLLGGLSATLFLPLSAYLLDTIGWRHAYLLFALLHLTVCMPIHWLVLRHATRSEAVVDGAKTISDEPQPPLEAPPLAPEHRKRAFLLIAVWSCTEGILQWGLYIQMIDVLTGMGLHRDTAVWAWATVGVVRVCARFVEMLSSGRHSIFATSMSSAMLMTLSFMPFAILGVTTTSTLLFCVLMGIGHGLFAVARNMLPLVLFGGKEIGTYMGLLLVPQNIVNALAPILFAFILARLSPDVALCVAGFSTCIGYVAVVALARFCRANMPQDSRQSSADAPPKVQVLPESVLAHGRKGAQQLTTAWLLGRSSHRMAS